MMQKFEICGGAKLEGTVLISGAKNAALPIMMTSLLTEEVCHYSNVPQLADVNTTLTLLARMGAIVDKAALDKDSLSSALSIQTGNLENFSAPYDLVKSMRASILVMGPLLAKYGQVKVALPGGCAIGSRPVDLHIKGLQSLGALITEKDGYLIASASRGLVGAKVEMEKVSVGATENIIMAATLASGTSSIYNAAKEPEIIDLCKCLTNMGAKIVGAGTECIEIRGVKKLNGASHKVQPDRIETGTYLVAAAITRGHVLVSNTNPTLCHAVIEKLREAGAEIKLGQDWIALNMRGKRVKAVDIETAVYPGFPTDMQAQFMALNAVADGSSEMTETIFENRFMHVQELVKMGANITIKGNTAVIEGVKELSGNEVMATDLRASASLVIAGLVANDITCVDKISHTDRGYESMEDKLSNMGAQIQRVDMQTAMSA